MEIETGDFVKIVGDCKATRDRFKIVEEMERYRRDDKAYEVYISKFSRPDSAQIAGYTWDIRDLVLVRKKGELPPNEPRKEKVTFFKFDEKLLDI